MAAGLIAGLIVTVAAGAENVDVTFPNGDRFVGDRNGSAVMQYAGGTRYEGAFVRGAPSGAGRLYLTNGDVFDGQFDPETGRVVGRYAFADGARLDAAFTAWLPDGAGVLTLADGTRFEGMWSAGAVVSLTRVEGAGEAPALFCFFGAC